MSIGTLKTEADLDRHIEQQLMQRFGMLAFHRVAGEVTGEQIPEGGVEQRHVAPDSVGAVEAKVTTEAVTVTAGNTSGTATVAADSEILGIYPTANQDQFVDSVAISGTTLTVTLAAAATADNTFAVPVLEP